MSLIRFLLKRVAGIALTVAVASVVIFGLTQVLPGDVPRLILGRDARPEAIEALRVELGLDQPVPVQYADWLFGFVRGDWGRAFTSGRAPILPLVAERLGNSLRLAAFTLLLTVPLSIALGTLAGLRENTLLDSAISIGSLAVVGLPEFVTALVLVNVFALGLGWFPPSATAVMGASLQGWIAQLFLPAVAASFVLAGYIIRMTRAGVIDELKKPYVRTATLKGLSRRTVIVKHVLRNALVPTITVIALSFGWLIGGLVVIENVFSFPGLGRLMTTAVERKDIPLLQACVMVVVLVFSLSNLLADLLYAVLNPRIRLE